MADHDLGQNPPPMTNSEEKPLSGEVASDAVSSRDTRVEPLGAGANNPIQQTLEAMLSLPDHEHYEQASAYLKQISALIRDSAPVIARQPHVTAWAMDLNWFFSVPWIAIVDQRETGSTQVGILGFLLFRNDLSGVYLTLSRARTDRSEVRRREAYQQAMRVDLSALRGRLGFLSEHSFSLDGRIDLRTNYAPAVRRFQTDVIASKFFERGNVPDDATIVADLDALLRGYDLYMSEKVQLIDPQQSTGDIIDGSLSSVQSMLESRSFLYTPWQTSTFITALQTKGFVILSGISGTGKTKLVQHFAAMLPRPEPTKVPIASADEIVVTVKPYMLKYGRFVVPARLFDVHALPDATELAETEIDIGGVSHACRMYQHDRGGFVVVTVLLRGQVRQQFTAAFEVGDRFILDPVLSEDQHLTGFRIAPESEWLADQPDAGMDERESNHLFLSVRPDWRDSKALLGYYNPLTEAYEWTPFLRFLERARRNFDQQDGLAWFVVLDEMNLAHVEYYFADLLSVMESGRGPDGLTNEALLLVYPETAEGDLPPREMRLPPNLYVVGTVNIDETTHAFSPKVLDRAFSIELVDVDFSDYPPAATGDAPELSDNERQALLVAFTREGRFPQIDKAEIAEYVADHPEVRERLQALNARLRHDNLHFGYRVFDEIVTFLAVADENGMFDGLGANAAFDAAVLMKVLPKFHGSRGKLERPLQALLRWCQNPDEPEHGVEVDPLASYALPKTAERVLRMLAELQTDGFTAFG